MSRGFEMDANGYDCVSAESANYCVHGSGTARVPDLIQTGV